MDRTEKIKLYATSLKDPIYAIETFLKTYDLTQKGYVPFNLFHKQKEIIKSYEKYDRNIVTKPRQAGVSTTTAAYIAVKIAFGDPNNPWKVLVLANKQTLAQEFLKKIKDFTDQIPPWVWGIKEGESYLDIEAKGHIKTKGSKCEVKALATSKDALRGYTPTFLIMDEAAFIDNGAEVFGAALTSLGTGGKVTLISTPNGMDPLYYKTYDGARTGKNNFKIVEMRWYEDVRYNRYLRWIRGDGEEIICESIGRDKLRWEYSGITHETSTLEIDSYEIMTNDKWSATSPWYENMCSDMNGDKRQIAQELDVSFITSGGNIVDEEYIEFHEKNFVTDPKYMAEIEKSMWIWREPEEDHKYIMGVDVSRGDGADSSTIVILDFDGLEQVAEFQYKLSPDILAEIVYKYGNLYQAYTIIDITGGMGVATVMKLLEMEYKYLHYDDPKSRKLSEKYAKSVYKQGDKVPGFNVGNTRLQMVSELEEHVRENKTIIRSVRLTSELKTFIYKNGRPDHMEGYHDDLIMSLAMCIFVVQTSFKRLERIEKQTKAMLESWITVSNERETDKIDKTHINPFYTNTPTYHPKQGGDTNNDGGEYNWLFGIK
tara:strand:- start:1152 stop:2948 length:1797 start_codon:yes stop_codon:yes gene_type:complete